MSRPVLEAGLDKFIPLIRQHKEMVSQVFGIKISIIMLDCKTLRAQFGFPGLAGGRIWVCVSNKKCQVCMKNLKKNWPYSM